jgi:D-glycero-D-manno-heptose 1,7-bisphosphate phosphatase
MTGQKAVFLDRDGTLNEEVNYLSRVDDLRLFPRTKAALKRFRDLDYLNIVITNQSGISRGFFTEEDLRKIHDELSNQLIEDGSCLIDEIFYSPYHPEGVIERYKINSPDRKPDIGLIRKAVEKRNIDLKESYFIGDSFTDMQCASNAGLRKILVATGYGVRDLKKCIEAELKPDFFAKDLYDAAEYIERMNLNNKNNN